MSAAAAMIVKENLAKLSLSELKEILALASIFKSKELDEEFNVSFRLFHDSVINDFKERINYAVPGLFILRKQNSTLFKTYSSTVESFNDWCLKNLRTKNVRHLTKFKMLIISLVLEDMEKKNISLTFKTFVYWFRRYQYILEDSFPGYIRSGMLDFLIAETMSA